ncbi:multiple inositol polyphosphate phosphatase 1 isoform X1 [Pelobates cultripes]|uniref:Multiple inositol polyphosphate phosphatase 1 n=1 Tax=Pelobates cultripes TaxID=61616 RepID=A0AAD1TDU9_PELCU|nr:multiple inositol polyphosphate phosphatase 1 isoform X1 [Pelobates cultripes]
MSFAFTMYRRCVPKAAQILLISVTWFCSVGHTSITSDFPRLASYFGTKTRYEEINPFLLENPLLVNRKQDLLPNTCTPLQIVSVIRHGTRYPTHKQIKKMKKMHNLILQYGGGSDLVEDLRNWNMWYEDWMDGQLVQKGEQDMNNLALRLSSLFPSLFTAEKFKNCNMTFLTSSKHRCVDSTKAFISGLEQRFFGFPQGSIIGLDELICREPVVNDTLMRFFDHCEKFVVQVEDNDTAMHEVDKFKESPEMMKVLRRISALLNIPEDELNADLIQVAFFTCSFELAINNTENSPWCKLFDEEDGKVLEYLNDLKQYWKRGYGFAINSRSSCSLFQHIFQHLETAVAESKRSQKVSNPVVMQFGHAETLLPLLALMGLFKDEKPLTAENFSLQSERKFRSGRIVPYASNLVFVLYHCDLAETPEDEYQVQMLLNENLLPFPHSHQSVCVYDDLKKQYSHLLENCHVTEECKLLKVGHVSEDEL